MPDETKGRGSLERSPEPPNNRPLSRRNILLAGTSLAAATAIIIVDRTQVAQAQQPPQQPSTPSGRKPNILVIFGDRNEYLPTVHGFDEYYGNLYHLNAEEDPESRTYPRDPRFLQALGPRGVLRCKASDRDDPTEQPRAGKVGKQTIEDTGPLNKKRMETIDDETSAAAIDFMQRQVRANTPFFLRSDPYERADISRTPITTGSWATVRPHSSRLNPSWAHFWLPSRNIHRASGLRVSASIRSSKRCRRVLKRNDRTG